VVGAALALLAFTAQMLIQTAWLNQESMPKQLIDLVWTFSLVSIVLACVAAVGSSASVCLTKRYSDSGFLRGSYLCYALFTAVPLGLMGALMLVGAFAIKEDSVEQFCEGKLDPPVISRFIETLKDQVDEIDSQMKADEFMCRNFCPCPQLDFSKWPADQA
jgi:hypothetical protein